MKIGIAKEDAGFPAKSYPPVDVETFPKDRIEWSGGQAGQGRPFYPIVKGRKYEVPDDYDFTYSEALFEPETAARKAPARKTEED